MLETENSSLLIVWKPQFSVGIKTKVDCSYHHCIGMQVELSVVVAVCLVVEVVQVVGSDLRL